MDDYIKTKIMREPQRFEIKIHDFLKKKILEIVKLNCNSSNLYELTVHFYYSHTYKHTHARRAFKAIY